MNKLFVAGATSELGNRVIAGLIKKWSSQQITCMVRQTSSPEAIEFLKGLGVRLCFGDVTDRSELGKLLDSDTIYIDMTHPKYYHKSIDIVSAAGVRRAFFITTTGIFSKYNEAADIYIAGEDRIKKSKIPYTIIRPSLIYGTERDRNMTKLLGYLNKFPIFPVFGKGNCLMQPVYVQDLADGIVAAVTNEELSRFKEYNLCGAQALTYRELLETACRALERKVCFLHIPHQLAVYIAGIGENIPGFPIKKEQVLRLLEDKQFDISLAQIELEYKPREFASGIQLEVAHLKAKGILK